LLSSITFYILYPTPPANLYEYNTINQSLINAKVMITKNWNILKFFFNDEVDLPDSINDSPYIKSIE